MCYDTLKVLSFLQFSSSSCFDKKRYEKNFIFAVVLYSHLECSRQNNRFIIVIEAFANKMQYIFSQNSTTEEFKTGTIRFNRIRRT